MLVLVFAPDCIAFDTPYLAVFTATPNEPLYIPEMKGKLVVYTGREFITSVGKSLIDLIPS